MLRHDSPNTTKRVKILHQSAFGCRFLSNSEFADMPCRNMVSLNVAQMIAAPQSGQTAASSNAGGVFCEVTSASSDDPDTVYVFVCVSTEIWLKATVKRLFLQFFRENRLSP